MGTQRAELEVFVRQCMGDVQKELSLARQRNEQSDLIEVLEAQERVIHLVYGKCFPNRPPSPDAFADDEDPRSTRTSRTSSARRASRSCRRSPCRRRRRFLP